MFTSHLFSTPRAGQSARDGVSELHPTTKIPYYAHLVPPEESPLWQRWGRYRYTGIDDEGLENIRFCAEKVIADNVPGDFVEAGVWLGGASIYMAAIGKFWQQKRTTWVLDSFQGMPKPNPNCPHEFTDYSDLTGLIAPLKEVQANFKKFKMLDQVVFVPGWFSDTIPSLQIDQIGVLRLDSDYYESTLLTISKLYPRVSPGGWVIVDDYDCVPGANSAIDQYRAEQGITAQMYRMNRTDNHGVYWQKTATEVFIPSANC
jgi:hypothetical protein